MKAQDAARATAAINPYGATPIAIAKPTVIGISILEVAVLDITSVIAKTVAVNTMIIKKYGNTSNLPSTSPNHSVSLESSNAAASDIPPPNKTSNPHGRFFISSHTSNFPFFFVLGMRNNVVAPNILMIVSVSRSEINAGRKPLDIHNAPVTRKIIPTYFSFLDIGPNFFNSSCANVDEILSLLTLN